MGRTEFQSMIRQEEQKVSETDGRNQSYDSLQNVIKVHGFLFFLEARRMDEKECGCVLS